MAAISHLLRRMIDEMTIRNLSPATLRSYMQAAAKLSRYLGRAPDTISLDEVRDFPVHLVAQGVPWGALNQTVCALRFFYGVMLGEATVPVRVPCARTPAS